MSSTHAQRADLIATAIATFQYHHAPTTYDRLASRSLKHGVTSYFGCWGQTVSLSVLTDGIQGANADAPAYSPVCGGRYMTNPPHADWCNAGDGLHFAINYTKNPPGQPTTGTRAMGMNLGWFIPFKEISDGTSHTIWAGERRFADNVNAAWCHTDDGGATAAFDLNCKHANGEDCGYPYNFGSVAWRFSSSRAGGVNFVFADGSVHFLSKNIARATYRALATYNAGDSPGPDAP